MTCLKNLYDVVTIKLLRAVSYCVVLSVASGGAQAGLFNDLDGDSQRYVERICLPVQYSNGTDSYRECIETQSEALSALGTRTATSLSFDDQYAIQQSCGASGDSGSSAFVDCVTDQINSLQGVPGPNLAPLAEDEVYALRQSCFAVQTTAGVRAYRQCLNQSIASLSALPLPDYSELSLLEGNAMQLKCSSDTSSVTDYRTCLLDALGQNSTSSPSLSTASAQTDEAADQNTGTLSKPGDTEVSAPADTRAPLVLAASEPNNTATLAGNTAAEEANTAPNPESSTEADVAGAAESPGSNADDSPATGAADEPQTPATPADDASGNSTNSAPLPQNDTTQDEQPAAAVSIAEEPATRAATAQSKPTTQAADSTVQAVEAEVAENSTLLDAQQAEAPSPTSPSLPSSSAGAIEQADASSASADGNTAGASASSEAPAATASIAQQAEEAIKNAAGSFDFDKLKQELKQSIAQLSERVRTAADDLSEINQFVLFAALALPILLVAFWQLVRGNPDQQQEMAVRRQSHSGSERSSDGRSHQSRRRRTTPRQPELTPASTPVSTHTAETHWQSRLNDTAHYDLGRPSSRPANHQRSGDHAVGGMPAQELGARPNMPPSSYDLWSELPADRKSLTEWLIQHEPDEQLSLAIEFIIYWMAFADERYEPELKKRIFTMDSPDDHDLIKRWVLKQDTRAFAEVVTWLQDSTTMKQGEQIITLLLALLVSENALTPSQNTLLRFLSDALGLGHERLGSIYRRAYGQPLPPLPRLDKPIWWDTQSTDQMKRWDARSVARQSLEIQFRVKLGLALSGHIDPEEMDEHFIRAVARCRPQRFDQLTHREQQLAKRQMAKFEMARDSLAEIST